MSGGERRPLAVTITETWQPERWGRLMTALQAMGDNTMTCPQCGAEQEDCDGFGFLACVPGCGLCSHPERDGGVCSICGDVEQPAAPLVRP